MQYVDHSPQPRSKWIFVAVIWASSDKEDKQFKLALKVLVICENNCVPEALPVSEEESKYVLKMNTSTYIIY